jgi:hypothetical protein
LQLLKRYVKTKTLSPGQSYVYTFTLATSDLAFYNRQQEFVAEAGQFQVRVPTPLTLTKAQSDCDLQLLTSPPLPGWTPDLFVRPHLDRGHLPLHLS